jgi:uncharacterized repeat protein (TIGR01451 family)
MHQLSMRRVLIVGLAGACFMAGAAEPVQVETTLLAEVRETVQTASGQQIQRLVAAKALTQGQVVYYTVRIHNPTPVMAREVMVVRRIPANTTYVENSATGPGANVTFSADGGLNFARPNQLTVEDPSGGTRRATVEDYTHIRWQLRYPLAPNAVALARFQAVFR